MKLSKDNSSIISCGIDIGSTSTHLTVSKLLLSNLSVPNQAPRLAVAQTEIIYESEIHLTPIKTDTRAIDGEGVARIVAGEYEKAGICAADVQTGAVIITGETARLRNAAEVLEHLCGLAGDFVVASAGPHLESMLAARGSGACKASKERSITICNIDIGGGTSNAAVYSNGQLLDTACLGIGGRCLQLKANGEVLSITESGETFFDAIAKKVAVGDVLSSELLHHYGLLIAQTIFRFFYTAKPPQVTQRLLITDKLKHDYKIDEYWISGGVAEFMQKAPADLLQYGDMGAFIADGLNWLLTDKQVNFHLPSSPILATVIGAGQHSIQLSGSTIWVEEAVLPVKNIPVIRPFKSPSSAGSSTADTASIEVLVDQILHAIDKQDLDRTKVLAVALERLADLSFNNLSSFSQALGLALDKVGLPQPYVLVCEQDIGLALGQMLRSDADGRTRSLIVIDGIQSDHGDFIDIGKPLPNQQALPVVVKDLIFKT